MFSEPPIEDLEDLAITGQHVWDSLSDLEEGIVNLIRLREAKRKSTHSLKLLYQNFFTKNVYTKPHQTCTLNPNFRQAINFHAANFNAHYNPRCFSPRFPQIHLGKPSSRLGVISSSSASLLQLFACFSWSIAPCLYHLPSLFKLCLSCSLPVSSAVSIQQYSTTLICRFPNPQSPFSNTYRTLTSSSFIHNP